MSSHVTSSHVVEYAIFQASIYIVYIDHGKMRPKRKLSNIRRTLVGNKIVDHSDVVGASPVGAAPTTSSFST